MRNALTASLKKSSGRKDVRIVEQPQLVADAARNVPITERAGLLAWFCEVAISRL